jgi:hypothetical protein
MTSKNRTEARDEVLFAFHEACERPTPEQIIEWSRRYPEYANDIREHAELQLSMLARTDLHAIEPDEATIARGWSRTLNAIYHAEQEAAPAEQPADQATFSQLIERRGTTIPALARQLDIDRLVIGELNSGRIAPPIGSRLLSALVDALGISVKHLEAALRLTMANPALGQAKAVKLPSVKAQTYEDVVLGTSMSEEKKQYWLGRDSTWIPGATSD